MNNEVIINSNTLQTREEKKLEAIMKAFERIDKKNERRNQRAEKRTSDPRSKMHKPLKLMPSRSAHKVSSVKSAYKKEHCWCWIIRSLMHLLLAILFMHILFINSHLEELFYCF